MSDNKDHIKKIMDNPDLGRQIVKNIATGSYEHSPETKNTESPKQSENTQHQEGTFKIEGYTVKFRELG